MLPRPYFCEKCHKTFRNASGREWHIAHRHDAPATLESIRTEYSARTDKLMADNQALTGKVERMELTYMFEKVQLMGQQVNAAALAAELTKENRRLEHEIELAPTVLFLQARGVLNQVIKPTGEGQGTVEGPAQA